MIKENVKSNQNLGDNLGAVIIRGRKFRISELFRIDEYDLDTEFRNQAAWYAFFAKELAEADYQLARAKVNKDRVYASCDLDYRADYQHDDIKYTEAIIRSEVMLDKAYKEARENEVEVQRYYNILKSIVSAMDQRASMLISLGAHRRAEFEMTGLHIKDQEFKKAVEDTKRTIRKRRKG